MKRFFKKYDRKKEFDINRFVMDFRKLKEEDREKIYTDPNLLKRVRKILYKGMKKCLKN